MGSEMCIRDSTGGVFAQIMKIKAAALDKRVMYTVQQVRRSVSRGDRDASLNPRQQRLGHGVRTAAIIASMSVSGRMFFAPASKPSSSR